MSIDANNFIPLIPGLLGIILLSAALFRSTFEPRSIRIESAFPILLLGGLIFFLAPQPQKGWLALAGVLLGGGLFFLDRLWKIAQNRLFWLGTLLLVFTAAHRLISDPLLFSYAALGLTLGLAVPAAFEKEFDALPALAGILAACLIWGDRLGLVQGQLPLFLAAICGLCLWLEEALNPQRKMILKSGALLLAALAAWMTTAYLFHSPLLFLPFFLGLLLALFLLLSRFLPASLRPLAAVFLAGTLLVLANRFFGIYGLSICGLGLLLFPEEGAQSWSVVLTVFAARSLLQLFLLRTNLNEAGVDITRIYAFAALSLAFLLPFVIGEIRRYSEKDRLLSDFFLLTVLLLPGFIGFFLHIEALAAFLAGSAIVCLVMGCYALQEELAVYSMPSQTLAAAAFSLLSAPWFLQMNNLPRQPRVIAFLALAALFSLCVFFRSARRSS